MQGGSKSSGNVHSSALPPWLQEEEDEEAAAAEAKTNPIGPTADDFAKHRKSLLCIYLNFYSAPL